MAAYNLSQRSSLGFRLAISRLSFSIRIPFPRRRLALFSFFFFFFGLFLSPRSSLVPFGVVGPFKVSVLRAAHLISYIGRPYVVSIGVAGRVCEACAYYVTCGNSAPTQAALLPAFRLRRKRHTGA